MANINQSLNQTSIKQRLSVTHVQTTVNMLVVMQGMQKLDAELGEVRSKVSRFKKSIEDSGLGGLDFSGLIKGGGLAAPFVAGGNSAIEFENQAARAKLVAQGIEPPKDVLGETGTNLKAFSDSVDDISQKFGSALLPAVNSVVTAVQPLLGFVAKVTESNPQLVQGLAAGALAFTAIRGAMTLASSAVTLFSSGLLASPIGLIALGIAVAAGLIVANWEPLSAFFVTLWAGIKDAATQLMAGLRTVFGWTPLGMVIANWGLITGFFAGLWEQLKTMAASVVDFFRQVFSWTPLGLVIENWTPLSGLFSALWELLKALSVPAMDFLKGLFAWTPLGMVINNWGAISGFFASLWAGLQGPAQQVKDFFVTLFDTSPLGMVINNWGTIGTYFDAIWATLKSAAQVIKDFFVTLFEWSPVGQVIANWQPISDVFAALWEVLKVLAAPAIEFMRGLFEWSPLGQIIKNWEPITEWFSGLWQRLQAVIAPIRELFDGGFAGFVARVTGKVENLTEAQRQTNAEGKGALAPAFFGGGQPAPGSSALSAGLPQSSTSLLQQSAANNRTQLQGGLTVSFENAPAGLRTSAPHINQPGVALSSRVGYRSLSLGGSNELA
ncbi:Phage tail length tape-measure protein [Pseudomonas chlororaphis]|uniref:Phage tail length tape-measure protein n=1 Tax=Pseudomonas chlororaphis TaxID=587753 RepID=A0A3G7TIJ7_9PSED|nr:phage tail protein [Pseudomonas chlororaphis]AZE46937.1 Phage tail length tape-measure protein [Pseudomonas chlororaphis]